MNHDRATLLGLPLFAGLEPETVTMLLEVVRSRRYRAGEVLSPAGGERDELFVVLRGEVAITRKDRLTAIARAPTVLGLSDVLVRQGGGRPVPDEGFVAFSDVETMVLPVTAVDQLLDLSTVLDRNVIDWLQGELRDQERTNIALLKHFEDFFAAPNARLIAGPYVTDPYPMYAFVMQDEPGRLRHLLPRGVELIPNLEGRYLLTFNFFERVRSLNPRSAGRAFSYHETTPFIPCIADGRVAGLYSPEMYPDNYLAITLGREFYGFPKRFAKTDLRAGPGGSEIDLVIDGRLVLRASWSEEQALSSEAFVRGLGHAFAPNQALRGLGGRAAGGLIDWLNRGGIAPVMPIFVHKQIPDCESTDELVFEIDELVEIPFHLSGADHAVELSGAAVRFLSDGWILGGECRGAFRFQLGFHFGRARERIDYHRRAPPGSGVLKRLRQLLGRG